MRSRSARSILARGSSSGLWAGTCDCRACSDSSTTRAAYSGRRITAEMLRGGGGPCLPMSNSRENGAESSAIPSFEERVRSCGGCVTSTNGVAVCRGEDREERPLLGPLLPPPAARLRAAVRLAVLREPLSSRSSPSPSEESSPSPPPPPSLPPPPSGLDASRLQDTPLRADSAGLAGWRAEEGPPPAACSCSSPSPPVPCPVCCCIRWASGPCGLSGLSASSGAAASEGGRSHGRKCAGRRHVTCPVGLSVSSSTRNQ